MFIEIARAAASGSTEEMVLQLEGRPIGNVVFNDGEA